MIKPKEIEVTTLDGDVRKYIIARVPAIPAREIVAQYPASLIPKIGDYSVNEAMMLKIMSYVAAIGPTGGEIMLTSRALIDNHVPDWETLAKIEVAMMEYNWSFFEKGKNSRFFEGIIAKAQALIIKTLTDLQAQSSPKAEPPSKS